MGVSGPRSKQPQEAQCRGLPRTIRGEPETLPGGPMRLTLPAELSGSFQGLDARLYRAADAVSRSQTLGVESLLSAQSG